MQWVARVCFLFRLECARFITSAAEVILIISSRALKLFDMKKASRMRSLPLEIGVFRHGEKRPLLFFDSGEGDGDGLGAG